jgi:tRNA nucleotidyltransferase (CCA-adding enzyme)
MATRYDCAMQTFVVGGAVRDQLLGLPVSDHDHVVVGATPEDMLAQGFKPVGADFPVFLHPKTHEEYALARTERKTAPGYKGFVFHTSPDVTLEEDLARRDLTINAMAFAEDGSLVDPYGGTKDLETRVLRHVSDAFKEDPVRILRVARFAARFAALGFTVAPETVTLMRGMTAAGEVDALVPERVWQEISRGLMEKKPSRMFEVLRECGALARLMPEVDRLFGVPQSAKSHPEIDTGIHVMMVVDQAALHNYSLPVRYAALMHDLGKGTTPEKKLPHHPLHEERSVELARELSARLKAPVECRELGVSVARWHGQVHKALELGAPALLELLDGADALRRPDRFRELLEACAADHWGRTGFENEPYPQLDYLLHALARLKQLDLGSIAAAGGDIPTNIRAHKLSALDQFLKERAR